MTPEQIAAWAEQAQLAYQDGGSLLAQCKEDVDIAPHLARFAALVAAHERERCAKYIKDENLWRGGQGQQGLMTPEEMARGIRAMR